MKFLSYATADGPGLGLVRADGVYALAESGDLAATIARLQASSGSPPAKAATPLATPRAAIPALPRNKILCVGVNYRDHAQEGKADMPDYPNFFVRYLSSFVADGDALVKPRVSDKFDFEAELTIVMGSTARHVPADKALDYIFGYTLAMDGSVRDYQKRTSQFTLGKNFDRSGALGRFIVTADELPPGARGLPIRSHLNGQLMQDGNTADLVFDAAALVAAASQCMTLHPGDLILTGTPAGVGFARQPPVYLKAGDRIEISIEGIGTLTNTVEGEPA